MRQPAKTTRAHRSRLHRLAKLTDAVTSKAKLWEFRHDLGKVDISLDREAIASPSRTATPGQSKGNCAYCNYSSRRNCDCFSFFLSRTWRGVIGHRRRWRIGRRRRGVRGIGAGRRRDLRIGSPARTPNPVSPYYGAVTPSICRLPISAHTHPLTGVKRIFERTLSGIVVGGRASRDRSG